MFLLRPCAVPPRRTACQGVKKMPVCFCEGLPMDNDLHSPKSFSDDTCSIATMSKADDYFPHKWNYICLRQHRPLGPLCKAGSTSKSLNNVTQT